jgi:tetratricopeptide (TPR) repeat protein
MTRGRTSFGCVLVLLAMTAFAPAGGASQGARSTEFANAKEKGKIEYTLENYGTARTYLEKAYQLNARDGETCYYLGKTLEALNLKAAARDYLSKARSFGFVAPDGEDEDVATPSGPGPSLGTPKALLGTVRKKWALVVGIGKFRDPTVGNLNFTAKDARDVATALTDPAVGRFKRENVRVLVDEAATTAAIKEGLEFIASRALDRDLVVIYLSSHGSPGKADLANEGYFITYDTDKTKLYSTAISMASFANDVNKRIVAKRKIVFLDTCYSGQAVEDGGKALRLAGDAQDTLASQLSGYGSVVITASSPNERSWESDKIQNGFFTSVLLESLRKKNGQLSLDEIYGVLEAEVPKRVKLANKPSQTPTIKPRALGEAGLIKIGVETEN